MGSSETNNNQHNPDHQPKEIATQLVESASDQVQALTLNHGKFNRDWSEEVEEEEKHDQDTLESYNEGNNGDHGEESTHGNEVAVEGKEEEENHDDGTKEEGEGNYECVSDHENGTCAGEGKETGVELGRMENSRVNQFPLRREAEDCSFYLRTGTCKYGMNCRFNHPPKNSMLKEITRDEHIEGTGLLPTIDCKYHDRPGGCKFGNSCKFSHANKVKLNMLGLPFRPGEKECPYYMRNGSCKYGSNCRFNHPDLTSAVRSEALTVYSNGSQYVSSQTQVAPQSPLAPWSPQAAFSDATPYMSLYSPVQGISSSPEWNAYQAPLFLPERNMHLPPAYVMKGPAVKRNITQRQQSPAADDLPERPGQLECSYYMRTGNCKYGSSCKFHHPKSRTSKLPSCFLSDLGLPLRPGQGICSFYSRYGICKYGPACKFDHPENYARSEESLAVSLGNARSRETDDSRTR